jgi:serine phosphatase RsbU (regulator of sigma subunit)/anti-sigma regulatory factor (Ser/Thr protein kinase)
MSDTQSSHFPARLKNWFYWFLVVIGLYSLIWDGLLEVDFITHPFLTDYAGNLSFLVRAMTALALVPLILIIAWLVLRRAPENVVGLFLVIWSATVASGSLRGDSPLRAWSLNFTWPTVLLLPFYFPDGKPSPRRLGWLIHLLAAICYSSLLLTSLTALPPPNTVSQSVSTAVPNALFVPALVPLGPLLSRILGISLTSIMVLLLPSLVIRYRRAGQRERLQMKWLALFSILFLILGTTLASAGMLDSDPNSHGQFGAIILSVFYLYLALFIPLGVANAIFRHRLYDIDILIRRTLIYSTLTVILAAVYFGGIILTQSVLRTLTGQTSDLAIAISTLAIAALYSPLRQRIQNAIDRRLYRRKYDAERTLTAFSATLRHEVDLDKLNRALMNVIAETMQPTKLSLWLREGFDNLPSVAFQPDSAGPALIPGIEVPQSDPLLAYCLSATGALDIASPKFPLQSAALEQMRATALVLTLPLVSQGELVGLLSLGARLSDQGYSSDDYRLLNNLAAHAATALRVAQLVRQRQIEGRQIERFEQELRIAGIIQQTLLPKEVPVLSGWQLAAYWQPAQTVGGDFYDFLPLPNGCVVLFIGDVTDKGVPAALLMASTRSVLRAAAEQLNSPGDVLARANDVLCPDMPPKMFVTCLCAFLDPGKGELRFANAGHNAPYLRTVDGVIELRARGMPLGLMPLMIYEEKEASLASGDGILFYSDGLVEAHNLAREMFGEGRLRTMVEQNPGGESLIDGLRAELRDFTGPDWEQEDDVTLVTLQRVLKSEPVGRRVLGEFSIASEPGNEREAIERVTEAIRDLKLSQERLERLQTAVAETTMNAMEHGNHFKGDLPVLIRVEASSDKLVVRVTDQGGGRPIVQTEAPDLDAKLAGLQSPRGWGLFLIKNMVDDVHITTEAIHHIVELIVNLKGDHNADPQI